MIQGCDCVSLAKQYGTPVYVVDKKRLKKNYFDFYNSFQQRYPCIEIAYSYKTNPLPGVLKTLHDFGASAEVVSPFELWLALKLGVPAERIIYNGPGKTEESLNVAVSNKIKVINIDDPAEIETINRFAIQHNHKQQVGVRVVTSVGWKSKLGISIKGGGAFKAFQNIKRFQNMIPIGLHVHIGTGINNIETYLQAIKDILDLSLLVRKELDITLKYFDFGGGFGVPTVGQYSALDSKLLANGFPIIESQLPNCPPISKYSQAIIELFSKYYSHELDDPPTIIFEPGRAITSSAQSLLLKVLSIKPTQNGVSTVIFDGGRNVASPLEWERHEVFHAGKIDASKDTYYGMFGPLCTPYDVLYKVKSLPSLQCGDIIAIMDAGAYFVPMQANFSFPRAAAVLLENGRHELIRKRECFEDIVAQDFPGQNWQFEKPVKR